ncbi:MAG: serine/threonine-protein kinase [Myxococcales bacterium]
MSEANDVIGGGGSAPAVAPRCRSVAGAEGSSVVTVGAGSSFVAREPRHPKQSREYRRRPHGLFVRYVALRKQNPSYGAVGQMVAARLQEGHLLGGKYRIDGVIGEGAMGVVVSAWHLDLQQRVAIKFLNPLLAQREDAVERFLREARAVVRIESEHVARVLDVGRLEGAEPYLVMEYLEGRDLAATLKQRRTLPIAEAVSYLQQACEAIAEAHAAGIVHRDLKPANLFLLGRENDVHRIKVLDFGISKMSAAAETAQLTNTSVIMGSPIYMSPEQLRSTRDVDEKADIWALGVILFEMLCGREPFVAQNLAQLCAMVLEQPPTALRSLRPDVPVPLERVVLRCLEKAASARFPTVAELSFALVPFGSDHALALASAERAARSLRRTGDALKSTLPGVVKPGGAAGSRWRVGFAVLVAAALLCVGLLRSCPSTRSAERAIQATGHDSKAVVPPTPSLLAAASPPAALAPSVSVGQRPQPNLNAPQNGLTQRPLAHAPALRPSLKPSQRRAPVNDHPELRPPGDNFGGRE